MVKKTAFVVVFILSICVLIGCTQTAGPPAVGSVQSLDAAEAVVAPSQTAAEQGPVATPTPPVVPTGTVEPTTTVTPLPDGVIAVYPDRERQVIREVGGGNFVHWPHNTSAFEPVSEFNLRELSPGVVRVRMSLDLWEPQNDDADPFHIAAGRFVDDGPNRYTFEMLQRFQEEGKTIIASAWDLPDWMVDFPDAADQRAIRAEMVAEAAETLTAWLKHARDQYGVQVRYISFNEADGGYHIQLSSSEYVELIQTAAPLLQAEDIEVQWLLADTANIATAYSYARAIWAHEDIRPFLGPLAFHSWDANAQDKVLQRLGDFVQQEGLEAWCTEAGHSAFLWQRPEEFPTWSNAQSLAAIYLRVLKHTRASTLLYWEMMAQDYPLNDGQQAYHSFQVLRLLQDFFPAEAVILDTSEDPIDIKWTAARLPDGSITVVLLNRGDEPREWKILGLPAGVYGAQELSEGGLSAVEDRLTEGQFLPVNIGAESILLLKSKD